MILIFLHIILNQAKIKSEAIEYSIGQFILSKDEQFNLKHIDNIPKAFLNNTGISEESNNLLFQSQFQFDQVIDLQKTQSHQIQQDIWILGKRNNFYYLAQLSTEQTNYQIIKQIYEILPSQFQCFSFQFLLHEQVVFDCTDFNNDFYLIFEIKTSSQYKMLYQRYISSIRKLHFIDQLNMIVIQNENLLFFIQYKQRNKRYQVFKCHKLQDNTLFISLEYKKNVIFKFKHSQIKFIFNRYDYEYQFQDHQIKNLTSIIDFEYNFYFEYAGILFYLNNNSLHSNQSDQFNLQFEGQYYNFLQEGSILTLQTSNSIQIINFYGKEIKQNQINHTFYNDKILININKQEIYVVNSTRLYVYYYGERISKTLKVDKNVIIKREKASSNVFIIQQINQSYIVENEYFQFRAYGNPHYNQTLDFIFSGGQMDLSFEKIDHINISINYLELQGEFICNKIHLISNSQKTYKVKSLFCQQNDTFQEIFCSTDNCIQQNVTMTIDQNKDNFCIFENGLFYFNLEGQDIQILFYQKNQTKLIYSQTNDGILVRFDPYKIILISPKQKQIQVITYFKNLQTQIINIYPRMIRFDELLNIMIIIENSIATLFILKLDYYHKIQQFELCEDFLDFIIIDIYLVQICKNKILKYTQITHYVFQYSGLIELYGENFNQNSYVLNSQQSYFYIIYQNQISIFNIKLPLKQSFIKKLILENFDQVVAILDLICIRRQMQVLCFKNIVQLTFQYDEDKFQYNQGVQLNICAENYYDKKCVKTIFQIQQTNKKIIVKEKKVKIYLNQTNNRKIKINNKYFSGSVHKIEADKFQFEQFRLKSSFDLGFVPIAQAGLQCQYFENFIKFDFQSETLLYDINQNQSVVLKSAIKSMDFLKINNYIILLGQRQITETFMCDDLLTCHKVCSFERGFNLFNLIDIYNDTVIIQQNQELIIYKFEICSYQIIKIFQISYSYLASSFYDNSTKILIYLDFDDQIHYEYNQIKQVHRINELFNNQQQIYQFWHINKIKLIKQTQIAVFITGMGSYFVQFSQSQQPQIISQLVPFQNKYYQYMSFHIQNQKILIIYSQNQNLILYSFDIEQIYYEKYIDYRYLTIPSISNLISLLDIFFLLNDNIYFSNSSSTQIQLFQTSYDHTLIIDRELKQNTDILITLSNSDQVETFIIELIVDEEFIDIKYIICFIMIIFFTFFLLKRQFHRNKFRMVI